MSADKFSSITPLATLARDFYSMGAPRWGQHYGIALGAIPHDVQRAVDDLFESDPITCMGLLRGPRSLDRIRVAAKESHEANLRRQWAWLGIRDGELTALETLPSHRDGVSYLALARSVDEAVKLTSDDGLVAATRWGRGIEPIKRQGVYLIPNVLEDRLDELVEPFKWAPMEKATISDERVPYRRNLFLDLDTVRRNGDGSVCHLPISAKREELHATIFRAAGIRHEMEMDLARVIGPDAFGVVGELMSGNGVQLWIGLDRIAETPETKLLVRELLAYWAALFDSDVSHVDTGVHDAKRIAPVAGTEKRKGIDRSLYRRVTFTGSESPRRLTLDELRRWAVHYRGKLTAGQRDAVAKTLGITKATVTVRPEPMVGGGLTTCNAVPIRDVAEKLGMDREHPVCPGCGSGGGSDVAFLDGRNFLNCKHARCSARPNRSPVDLVAKVKFNCDNIKGSHGVVRNVLEWFRQTMGVTP